MICRRTGGKLDCFGLLISFYSMHFASDGGVVETIKLMETEVPIYIPGVEFF